MGSETRTLPYTRIALGPKAYLPGRIAADQSVGPTQAWLVVEIRLCGRSVGTARSFGLIGRIGSDCNSGRPVPATPRLIRRILSALKAMPPLSRSAAHGWSMLAAGEATGHNTVPLHCVSMIQKTIRNPILRGTKKRPIAREVRAMPARMPYGHSRIDIAMGRFLINSRGLQCYKRCLRSEIVCSKGRSERAAQTE